MKRRCMHLREPARHSGWSIGALTLVLVVVLGGIWLTSPASAEASVTEPDQAVQPSQPAPKPAKEAQEEKSKPQPTPARAIRGGKAGTQPAPGPRIPITKEDDEKAAADECPKLQPKPGDPTPSDAGPQPKLVLRHQTDKPVSAWQGERVKFEYEVCNDGEANLDITIKPG
jgi:hypothetical protein